MVSTIGTGFWMLLLLNQPNVLIGHVGLCHHDEEHMFHLPYIALDLFA